MCKSVLELWLTCARAAQQIKFAKMPVRARAGSSPVNNQNPVNERQMTSPSRQSGEERYTKGSVEVVKQRARRDTATSSDLSSENELDSSVFQRRQIRPSRPTKNITFLDDHTEEEDEDEDQETHVRLQDVAEEGQAGGPGSGASTLSSEFAAETADSESLLDADDDHLDSSSLADLMPPALNITAPPASPRKARAQAANHIQPLPPPRPISTIIPVSALGQAIRAQKTKPKNPVELFARFSGKGALNPLNIKIYAPFSKSPLKPYELPLQKTVQDSDSGAPSSVSVADAIGLSLWRYTEEKLEPSIPPEKQDVNRWTLRMVDDGEVDDEFPALNRASNITDFTSNNNRPARGRSRGKAYDEFALVEATETQYRDNQRVTPKYTKQFKDFATDKSDSTVIPASRNDSESAVDDSPLNTVISKPFAQAGRKGSATLDTPAVPLIHSTPRMGPPKQLRIHFTTLEAQSQSTTIEITADTYLAEVLDSVCKRWNLDKAHHYFRVSGTSVIAPSDRTVETLGARNDLDLVRQRFANAGAHGLGSSPSSSSPNAPLLLQSAAIPARKPPKKSALGSSSMSYESKPHPLSNQQDAFANTSAYKRYNVIRKNPMSFTPSQARTLLIDGEYLHILPGDAGKTIFDAANAPNAKTAMVPFSMIVGCKVSRRHPKSFRVVVFRERETKRYDFETAGVTEAAEIVGEIRKGMEPFFNAGMDMG